MPSAHPRTPTKRGPSRSSKVESHALSEAAPFAVAASRGIDGAKEAAAEVRHRVVAITGASSGVGRATAHAFARRGALLGLIARGGEALEATAREVEALGGEAVTIRADVADPEQVEEAARSIERRFGPIDVWINGAVASVFTPAWRASPDELRRVTDVAYLGAAYGTLAALRRMRPRNHGTVVMLGAALSYRGMPLQSAYCAAKHALHGFTESLRCELLHEGSSVHLTTVHLPAINTPQFDMARSRMKQRARPVAPVFQPEVAAEGILWAVEHHRRELVVGGATALDVLGNKLAPALGERYLARRGYETQQTDEEDDPRRPDNLFEPIPGDHGVHGSFDEVAKSRSAHLWLTTHRTALAAIAASAALGAALGAWLG